MSQLYLHELRYSRQSRHYWPQSNFDAGLNSFNTPRGSISSATSNVLRSIAPLLPPPCPYYPSQPIVIPKLPPLRLELKESFLPQFPRILDSGFTDPPLSYVHARAHHSQESGASRISDVRPIVSNKGKSPPRVEVLVSGHDSSLLQPDRTRKRKRVYNGTRQPKRLKPPEPYSSHGDMLLDIIPKHPRGKMTIEEIYSVLEEEYPENFPKDKATWGGWRVYHPRSCLIQ